MLKKLLSSVVIVWLLFTSILSASAANYKGEIDTVMKKLSIEQMHKLDSRIDRVFETTTNISFQKRTILSYIKLSIGKALVTGQAVSADEELQISDEIMKIQNNMAAGIDGQLEALVGELVRLYSVEEKWKLSLEVDANYEQFWSIELDLGLSNYVATTSGFDSQIKTDLSVFLSADMIGQKINFDMSAFLDYITQDGNIYLLLEDLKINSEITQDLEEMINMLQKIANLESYIAIENDSNLEAVALLESFAPNIIIDDIKAVFEKPLLKVHSKRWAKYILIPTKYACDQGKLHSKKFDPFYGSDNCSEGQYDDLVKDVLQSKMHIYMTLGENTILWMSGRDDDLVLEGNVIFNDTNIISSDLNISEYDNNINFQYRQGSHISFDLIAERWNLAARAYMWLDSRNYISSADIKWNYKDNWGADMNMKLVAQSGNISWSINIVEDGEKYMTMSMDWKYRVDKFDMEMSFEIFENPFESDTDIKYVDEKIEWSACYEYYDEEYNYYCYIEKEPSWDTLTWNLTIKSDTRYSNNNLSVLFNMLLWNQEIIQVKLINMATQTFKENQISTPENATPYQEVFPEEEDELIWD